MRISIGLAVAVVAGFVAPALALGTGCSREPRPVVHPEERAPLPPASGTPIGFLVDDAAELRLGEDQLAQLKAIDEELVGRLGVLDGKLRSDTAAPPPTDDDDHARGRGLGFFAGGHQGGRDGRSGSTGAWTGIGAGSAGADDRVVAPGPVPRDPNAAAHVAEERTATTRAALTKAFALLDAAQREIARRVLANHGVDPDAEGLQAQPAGSPERALDPDPGPRRR